MEPIRTTIEKIIEDWRVKKKQTPEEDILKAGFKKILTKQEQKHVKYCSLQNSRVILGVDSSAWLYILNLKKRHLLRSLNQMLQPKKGGVEIFLKLHRNQEHKR